MDIRKKLFVIIAAAIVVTALPGAAVMYAFTQSHTLRSAALELQESTGWFADAMVQRMQRGEPKLQALAHLLEKSLAQPIHPGELQAFERMVERNPDGVWRNRRPGYDGANESGVFLPEEAGLNPVQKVRHLRIKHHLDQLGAASGHLENLWYLSPQRSEVIFDRAYPQFAFDQKADNDYTQTPWVLNTSPERNPGRHFGFTPPLFDPVPRVWMVSAIYPLYVNGEWLGTLGEDLPLSGAFKPLSVQSKRYPGTQHFLLDQQGNFVLAGAWQQQLESGTRAMRPDLSQEPQFAAMLQETLSPSPQSLGSEVMLQGKPYLAIGMQLAPLGWKYFNLTPVDEIMAPTRELFLGRAAIALLLLLAGGSAIGFAVGTGIARRILVLRDVMQGHALDSSLRFPQALLGHDEIGDVARAYNALADDTDRHIAERKQAQSSLANNEELWRFALEGAGYGVWDWNIAQNTVSFSQRSQEMLEVAPQFKGDIRRAWMDRIHPDDTTDALAVMQAHLRGTVATYTAEYRVRCGGNAYKWILNRGRVVSRDAHGKALRVIGTHTDITARKAAETRLANSKLMLQTLLHAMPDLIWLKDGDGHYMACNQRFEQFFGASQRDIVGKTDYDFIAREMADFFRANDRVAVQQGGLHINEEWVSFASDGHKELLETTKLPVIGAGGELLGVLGIGHDITARKQAEDNLKLAASVFTHAREAIMITAADGSIINVNDAFTRITGYSREDVMGQNPRILNSGRQPPAFYNALWRDLTEQGFWFGEVWNRRKNGEVYAEMQTISAVRDAQGKPQHYVALFSDITASKAHQQQLEHIAHFDALTNLPNRVLLADRLHQAMTQSQRRGQLLAVAYLDLDGFKSVNDHYGHDAGDQLLVALSTRMKQALREGDTLARIGGDEFVAVLADLPGVADCVPLLTRLLGAAAQPVDVDTSRLQVSASLGVTMYPQSDPVDADQLLRQADQAMYQAKLAGKNRYHFFDAEQDRSVRGHHESLDRIRRALAQREFVLHYQPKVNMRTGQVVGVEALIRWQHPERGLLAPALFLPVTEDHPIAVEIGEWVIHSVLTQIEQWRTEGLELPVSVNVGARQLQQIDFVDRLRAILAAHPQIDPTYLELEVLETSALEDVSGVSRVIEICHAMGIQFALDDFGTGYSSLTYLKRLPASLLKIDQSFVRDMLDDPDDLAILEGVVGLASAFRRQVIAEGVETIAHGEMLLQVGCDLAQGYGIAHPMSAQALPQWVRNWKPDAVWANVPLISRDDLPLLVASVEHRAWTRAMENYLKGERSSPPELDHRQCHFGTWLHTHGRTSQGAHPDFAAMDLAHRGAHLLAAELCALKAGGAHPEALERIAELHDQGDLLLGLLRRLSTA